MIAGLAGSDRIRPTLQIDRLYSPYSPDTYQNQLTPHFDPLSARIWPHSQTECRRIGTSPKSGHPRHLKMTSGYAIAILFVGRPFRTINRLFATLFISVRIRRYPIELRSNPS